MNISHNTSLHCSSLLVKIIILCFSLGTSFSLHTATNTAAKVSIINKTPSKFIVKLIRTETGNTEATQIVDAQSETTIDIPYGALYNLSITDTQSKNTTNVTVSELQRVASRCPAMTFKPSIYLGKPLIEFGSAANCQN